MEDIDGFRVVSRKKGRKRGNVSGSVQQKGIKSRSHETRVMNAVSTATNSNVDTSLLLKKISDCVNDLGMSNFYTVFKETWLAVKNEISVQEHSSQKDSSNVNTHSDATKSVTVECGEAAICERTSTRAGDPDHVSSCPNVMMQPSEVDAKKTNPQRTLNQDKSDDHDDDDGGSGGEDNSRLNTSTYHRKGTKGEGNGGEGGGGTRRAVGEVKEIICYGLGNFASCVTARFQLALLILLNSLVSPVNCSLYDPNFTEVEKAVIVELGFTIISFNEEGKRVAADTTLFFMPHCGKPLYNNLLWANWGQRLCNILLLGNSFNNFSLRFTDKQLNEEVPFISKILPYHKELQVTNNFQFSDIFNDMAFHIFPKKLLRTAPPMLWDDQPEPSYDHMSSVEIVMDPTYR